MLRTNIQKKSKWIDRYKALQVYTWQCESLYWIAILTFAFRDSSIDQSEWNKSAVEQVIRESSIQQVELEVVWLGDLCFTWFVIDTLTSVRIPKAQRAEAFSGIGTQNERLKEERRKTENVFSTLVVALIFALQIWRRFLFRKFIAVNWRAWSRRNLLGREALVRSPCYFPVGTEG